MSAWDRNRPESDRTARARRPLPDYQSRAVQLRLFVLVAALMIVLVAMNEARKPAMWAWMWRGEQLGKRADKIDSRLAPRPSGAEESAGTVYAEVPAVAHPQPLTGDLSSPSPDHESAEAWRRIWESLSRDEQSELERLLRSVARQKPPTADDAQRWESLALRLDELWQRQLDEQNRASFDTTLANSAEQRKATLARLTDIEEYWKQRWQPAFSAAGTMPSDEQRAVFLTVRQMLDANAMQLIRDDTVWRHDERAAWFRLVERLQTGEVPNAAARVGFVQVFRQPDEYRGQLVTMRGTVELAYRVQAPPNDLSVKDYCLFWLRPEDGTNLPIVVYALEPPPGFPPITTAHRKMREPVEVTGFFFKRWVYRAADGLNSVPMLLTKSPRWEPIVTPPPVDLTWQFWGIVIVAMLAVAGGLVRVMATSTRLGRSLTERSAATPSDDPAQWENLASAPPVPEPFQRMEGEAT